MLLSASIQGGLLALTDTLRHQTPRPAAAAAVVAPLLVFSLWRLQEALGLTCVNGVLMEGVETPGWTPRKALMEKPKKVQCNVFNK